MNLSEVRGRGIIGQQYKLVFPTNWFSKDTSDGDERWNHEIVTLIKIHHNDCIDADGVCDCYECKSIQFTHGVKHSIFEGVFRAKPAWLFELNKKTICTCSSKALFERGCANPEHI